MLWLACRINFAQPTLAPSQNTTHKVLRSELPAILLLPSSFKSPSHSKKVVCLSLAGRAARLLGARLLGERGRTALGEAPAES